MTDEYDPAIQQLFDIARQDARDDVFVAAVMAQVNAQRRRVLLAWGAVGAAFLVAAVMLTGPVTEAVGLLTRLMPQPLVDADMGNALINELLTPVNSFSAIVGISLLMLIYAVRKLFGRC